MPAKKFVSDENNQLNFELKQISFQKNNIKLHVIELIIQPNASTERIPQNSNTLELEKLMANCEK